MYERSSCRIGEAKNIPRNLANVHALMSMFDIYYCIKSVLHAFISLANTSTDPCVYSQGNLRAVDA